MKKVSKKKPVSAKKKTVKKTIKKKMKVKAADKPVALDYYSSDYM